jgi:ATP-dependent helicase HepA
MKIQPFIGQRYLSEAEPELGLGVISELADKSFTIFFKTTTERRNYSIFNAPLRRVLFEAGDEIILEDQSKHLIDRVEIQNDLATYVCGDLNILEQELSSHLVFNRPEEKLYQGFCDDLGLFKLRAETRKHYMAWKCFRYKGFLGARINFLPHQLFVASKVSQAANKRFVLADEVGLGKTIEASLLIHRFLLMGSVKSVLIIVPDALVNQWFVELYRKFNFTFSVFNRETLLAEKGNPFSGNPLSIVSLSLLRASAKAREYILETNFEMLVVDEAHQLRIDVEEEKTFFTKLSSPTFCTLFLSATPEHKGSRDHFEKLKLLDPKSYQTFEDFQVRLDRSQLLSELLESIKDNKEYKKESHYLDLVKLYPRVKDLDEKSLIEVISVLGGPGKNLIRNTRKSVVNKYIFFPERRLHPYFIEYDVVKEEGLHQKLVWLVKFLEGIGSDKVLLICRSKELVLMIEEYLRRHTVGIKTGTFHSDLSLLARDRQAAYFHDTDGAQILLCTEIGSEGRNFEFCHHLVLFDLPERPDLIEQRIGRLDRIGQKHHIELHVPVLKNDQEELSFLWLHEGINIFERYRNYANLIYEENREELEAILEAVDFKKFKIFKKKIEGKIGKLDLEFLKHRDYLIEINSYHEESALAIVKELKSFEKDHQLSMYLDLVFHHFGVDSEALDQQIHYIKPSDNMFIPYFPHLPSDGLRFTFDRHTAMEREDVHFMSWEHPLVQGIMELILSEGYGNANLSSRLKPGKSYLECFFLYTPQKSKNVDIFSYLHPFTLRVLIDSSLEDLSSKWDSSFLDQNSAAAKVEVLKSLSRSKDKINQLIAKSREIMLAQLEIKKVETKEKLLSAKENELSFWQVLESDNDQFEVEKERRSILDRYAEIETLLVDSKEVLDGLRLII